jgi:hypothetical protein
MFILRLFVFFYFDFRAYNSMTRQRQREKHRDEKARCDLQQKFSSIGLRWIVMVSLPLTLWQNNRLIAPLYHTPVCKSNNLNLITVLRQTFRGRKTLPICWFVCANIRTYIYLVLWMKFKVFVDVVSLIQLFFRFIHKFVTQNAWLNTARRLLFTFVCTVERREARANSARFSCSNEKFMLILKSVSVRLPFRTCHHRNQVQVDEIHN